MRALVTWPLVVAAACRGRDEMGKWWMGAVRLASGGSAGSGCTPLIELLLQQFLGGQVELILFRVDVGVFRQGEFDDGLFGGFAEEEADGGVFVGELHLAGGERRN